MTLGERPIGDLVDKCHTWNPKASGAGNFDYIDLSSIDKDTKSIASIERHECSKAPSRARQLVEAGDVLVATVRPNLNGVALVNGAQHGMTASTGYCVLRPNEDKLASGFLFHWVKTGVFVQRMVSAATGASYPAVSDLKVKASTIPLPPLAEQKRIAGILDAADALRAKRRESLAQLDTLLQSTFLDMFGDPVTNPMGWDFVRLGEAFELKHGFAFKSEQFVSEGEYVLLTPGNFFETGGFRDRGEKQRYHNGPVPHEYVLEEGDLLVAMTEQAPGLLGSPILVPEARRFLHNQRLGKVVKKTEIDSAFIFELMNASSIRARIQNDSTGTKVKHTSPKKIAAIEFGHPPLDLQRRFATIVGSIEQQRASQRDHLDELDTLFASLQSRAFRGDL